MPSNTARIAKNTLLLYFRQILIMLVNLYTVRVVLNTLGAEDYGIYNVVAGVVTMFSFLSTSMETACQRYFSFEIGRRDYEQLKKTFSLCFTIFVLIGIIVLLFAETVGLWVVNTKLVIPIERIYSARCIYHATLGSFFLTIITMPYRSLLIAHEDMSIYAYCSIFEVILKLLIVYMLQIIMFDKLLVYGILLLVVTFIMTGIYRFICMKKYSECAFKFYWNHSMFMELSGYVGWNLFWVVAILVKNQGINILLNVFFGPLINSAQAISRQISHAVISFTQNFTIAFNPQIVKSYASGNISEMLILIFRTTKISFFLIILFLVPLQLELTFVLELWLKQIPEYVTIFTRIFLIEALIESLCYPLTAGSRATGKIALYQTISSGLMVLSLPIAFIFLKNNFPVVGVQMIVLILFLFIYIVRIFMLSNQLKFSIRQYLLYAITPSIFTLIAGSIMPVLFVTLHKEGFIRLLLTTIISTISIMICAFFIGLSKNEKVVVVKIVKKALLKDGTV